MSACLSFSSFTSSNLPIALSRSISFALFLTLSLSFFLSFSLYFFLSIIFSLSLSLSPRSLLSNSSLSFYHTNTISYTFFHIVKSLISNFLRFQHNISLVEIFSQLVFRLSKSPNINKILKTSL